MFNEITQEQAIKLCGDSGTRVDYKDVPMVVIVNEKNGRPTATGWIGKAKKPSFNYYFMSKAQRARYLQNRRQALIQKREAKIARQEAKKQVKAGDYYQVMDVIQNEWGYNQTNVDFYQVVKVNPKSIVVRQIAKKSNDHGGPYGGKCAPVRGEFIGSEELKKVDQHGRIRFKHGGARKWDGRQVYCSSYH